MGPRGGHLHAASCDIQHNGSVCLDYFGRWVCEVRTGLRGVCSFCVSAFCSTRGNAWLAVSPDPRELDFQRAFLQATREALYPQSCFYPHANNGSSMEHSPQLATREIREEEAFPAKVPGQGCRLQGAAFWGTEPPGCT